ncbi:MAG: ABC transporter permease [bacterium]
MRYETFIALRYLRSRRRTRFISFITWISVGGVAIGVAALVIVLSVMNGLETEVREKILSMDAHLKVTVFHDAGIRGDQIGAVTDSIRSVPEVVGITPYIETEGMLQTTHPTPAQATAVIRGIDPETADRVYTLSETVEWGGMDFSPRSGDTEGVRYLGLVVGYSLSQQVGATGSRGYLAVLPRLGDEEAASVIFTRPRIRNFYVSGVFRSDLYEYDASYAYMDIEAAQELTGMEDRVTGLAVKLDDMWSAEAVKEELNRRLPYPYWVYTWIDQNKNLFSWMTIEKWAMFIVLGLIILVAAFNIISTLVMVVLEKTKEIGVLKAMGASRKAVQRVFTRQGMFVGVLGTAAGLVLGYGFCWAQQTFRLIALPPDVYFVSAVPIDMRLLDFALITGLSLLICLVASLYPARRAGGLHPVEAIRDE